MRTKLLIVVPYYWPADQGGIAPLTLHNVHTLKTTIPNTADKFALGTGPAFSRCHALADSRKKWQSIQYDHVLFVDSDNGFRGDVVKLVSDMIAYDKPVVGCPYRYRDGQRPGELVAGYWLPKHPGVTIGNLKEPLPTGEQSVLVDWIGAGFLLVRRDVFSKIPYPWFWHPIIEYGEEAENASEDLGFCKSCLDAGIEIHAYTTIVEHNRNAKP